MTARLIAPFDERSTIVIKIGSSLVTNGGSSEARHEWMASLAADTKVLRQRGCNCVLVSSGAIALGRKDVTQNKFKRLDEKQAAAAIGQPRLIFALTQAFAAHDTKIAQSLLTLDDTETRRRWLNARATLNTLLRHGVLPVINENDTVATDEIRYGDNDRLAARVAQMIGADALVLLSDIDGLYTADPRSSKAAQHLPEITEITAAIEAMAGDANESAGVGSGGMRTKIDAAKIAWSAGCKTIIADGTAHNPLAAIEAGGKATWFLPPQSPAAARQNWLQGHLSPEGTIYIDAGAAKAVAAGASLLAVGVTSADGNFERGAAVAIKGPNGDIIAKGITAYSAENVRNIAGLQSDAIETRLGTPGRPAIIHRDDLVRV